MSFRGRRRPEHGIHNHNCLGEVGVRAVACLRSRPRARTLSRSKSGSLGLRYEQRRPCPPPRSDSVGVAGNLPCVSAIRAVMDVNDQTVGRLREWAAKKSAVRRLWLFGSRARGDWHFTSDVDLAIELMPPKEEHDWALGDYTALHKRWRVELGLICGPLSLVAFRDDLNKPFDPRIICLWSRHE